MHLIKADHIVSQNRQRKEMDSEALIELSNSISSIGLIHPVVVRRDAAGLMILVAGERRLKAIQTLWAMGQNYSHGGIAVPEGQIACTYFHELDPLDAMEIELEENIRREDLSWQSRCETTSQLHELRRLQAEKRGDSLPTTQSIAKELYPDHNPNAASTAVRLELILARQLKDPEVAKASSMEEGLKVIRRKEEAARSAALGESVGRTFSVKSHSLLKGDCLLLMKEMNDGQFDCILTDPPYGIDAQDFNDSGGKANAAGHTYDDSLDNWLTLMLAFVVDIFRLAKPQAHAYIFCDIDNFLRLRDLMANSGWRVFRTPLVWHNPSSQRAPWPQMGPHRRYQLCLYAIKGDRPVLKLASDLVEYRSDENLGWAAQKPVGLYNDLLTRTCRAGDSVLDPFAGTGTVFPAAHGLKVKATGIEIDPAAYGIAVKRLGELK
jgi:DNA modification methylase